VENVIFDNVTLGGTKMPLNPAETPEIKLNSY